MRDKFIIYLKTHPNLIRFIWSVARGLLGFLVKFSKKQDVILFCSFGGRGFNDSPKALYDEICKRNEFKNWRLVWAFIDPERFIIPRGEKIKIDTITFFKCLVTSRIWISNSGMDRGIDLITDKIVRVETWHGTPLKRICGEENETSIGNSKSSIHKLLDNSAIRCAQSEFDREIFARIFNASKESFLLSDLPRNDELLTYTPNALSKIYAELGLNPSKKIILYTPTYREYMLNNNSQNYIDIPIDLVKWERVLGNDYVLLIRAHYAVSAALGIKNNSFVKDVSDYYSLNNLYAIADMMISDYSSTYFDYSILDRPMICFAYDKEIYEEKRGLYLKLEDALPCRVCKTEDEVINEIQNMDISSAIEATKSFHKKYAPYAGHSSKMVIDKVISKLG